MRFPASGSENPASYGPVTTCAFGRKVTGQSGWGPQAAFLAFGSTECPSPPGRTYTLIFRRVLAEDAGEIKFVAENAESRAHLRVKGEEGWGRGGEGVAVDSGLPQALAASGPLPDRAAVSHKEGREYVLLRKSWCKEFKLRFASGHLYPADSRSALGGTLDLAPCWPRWSVGLEWRSISWLLGAGQGKPSGSHHPTVSTELPVTLLRPLRDKIAMEKHRGVLECQVSRASAQVRWFKGGVELQPGPKYEVVSDGLYRKLVIKDVQPDDEDTYTCDAGDVKTSAQFFVEGMG